MNNTKNPFEDCEVIVAYTRAQALEDGELVDVSDSSEFKELGFRYPIALTRAVWTQCVEIPKGVTHQDLKGRLWDVLWMFRHAIRGSNGNERVLSYSLHVRNDNREGAPPLVHLKAVCGPGDSVPGDQGEPVITIMFPDED